MTCASWLPLDEGIILGRGGCDSVLLFRIDRGRSNRTTLSGRTMVVAMDFTAPNPVERMTEEAPDLPARSHHPRR